MLPWNTSSAARNNSAGLSGRIQKALSAFAPTTGLTTISSESSDSYSDRRSVIDGLVSHAVLDNGALVVAHAGLPESMHGRASNAVRSFALYGDTTGETDEFGLPVRYPWANDYRGRAAVVYGHTPVPEATWVNGTICIDTGCVFGGKLTALRWPERELVSVPALQMYYEPTKPLAPPLDERGADELDPTGPTGALADLSGNGISNLLKFAFALDPHSTDISGLPVTTIEPPAPATSRYLTLRYRRLLTPGPIQYVIEVSSDFLTWASTPADYEEIAPALPTGDGLTETVTVRVLPAIETPETPARYIRVRVVVP